RDREPGRRCCPDRSRLAHHRPRLARTPWRVAAQHQLVARPVLIYRVECPGLARGTAGHEREVLDAGNAERALQMFGERRGHSCTPFGARWSMNPNMYPATRRIWISSAPSVMRYRR